MRITKVEFTNRKPHLQKDPETGKWMGYRVDVRARTKRYRDTFRTKAEAERFVNELLSNKVYNKAGLETAELDVPKISEVFKARLAEIDDHRANLRAARVFKIFENLLDLDIPVTTVRRSHFREYIKQRTEDGVKNETINREINELSAALNRAEDLFPKRLKDFEAQTARPKVNRKKAVKREIEPDEAAALANVIRHQRKLMEKPQRTRSRPAIANMFELAWMLGLRIGETEALLKENFNPERRSLKAERMKTKEQTNFPALPDRAMTIIEESIAASTSDRIFQIFCERKTVDRTISDACKELGIPYGRGKADAITFHSTRHSFTSRLVRVTDFATAQSFTQHSTGEMLGHYSHPSEERRVQAMEAMYGPNDKAHLQAIFKNVRSRKMNFDEFCEALKLGNGR